MFSLVALSCPYALSYCASQPGVWADHASILQRPLPLDQHQSSQAPAAACGKTQHLVPYFIAGHPGSDLKAMIRLAQYNKRKRLRPDKVQDFIPGPMDIATSIYHTGLDPISGERVYVAKGAKERQAQRALLQFWKPENYDQVKKALIDQGRQDLIGAGDQCLISSRPPEMAERYRPRHSQRGKEAGEKKAGEKKATVLPEIRQDGESEVRRRRRGSQTGFDNPRRFLRGL